MRPADPTAAGRLLLIDLARGTRIARRRAAYERSQWSGPAALESLQAERLGALLAHARASVPYYRRLDAGRKLTAADGSALSSLGRFPVIRKEDIRSRPEDFQCPTRGVRTFARHTGGSTGTPFHYLADVPALSEQWAAILRAWEWSGYRFGDRMVTLGGNSVVAAGGAGLRHRVYNLLRNNHALAAADLDEAGIDAVLGAIRNAKPELIYGYPSLLYLLAEHARARGAGIRPPRAVVTTSEMLFPGQRAVIGDVFGAPVFDLYGCNEVNLTAAECEHHDGWHFAMEATIVEILDDSDRPLPAGAVGRIVGTALHNRVMPFIRYDTGDLGSLEPAPCPCGRGLARLRTIQGRSRDLVRTPDGRHVHGVAFNDLVLGYPWIDRYQAVQLDAARLRLIIACRHVVDESRAAELRGRVAELTGLDVELSVNGDFETTSGHKTRVIVSRLEPSDGR